MADNPYRALSFESFLDTLLTEDCFEPVVAKLRASDDRDEAWHSLGELLRPFPLATEALNGFAYEGWDPNLGGFSSGNLKAVYVRDEDFINGGRAFVLFNLVASNWTHVGQVGNQAQFWKRVNR